MASFTKLFLAIFLAGQTLFATCQAEVPCAPVRTRACPGVEPKASLVGVYIQDCFEEPCTFRKSQNVTMEMDIDFKGDVENLEAKLYALLGSIEIGWDGLNPNACEDILSEGDCPFHNGDYVTYGVNLYIAAGYPTVTADVKFMVLDEKKEVQVCWIVKASVRGD